MALRLIKSRANRSREDAAEDVAGVARAVWSAVRAIRGAARAIRGVVRAAGAARAFGLRPLTTARDIVQVSLENLSMLLEPKEYSSCRC